jgi:hypothetical protein
VSEPRIVVTGTEEVVRGFDELERFVGDLTETHRRVLGPLIPEVRARTPVKSGRLASSWSLEASATAGSIESGLVYAGPIEFGSSSRGIEPVAMVRSTLSSNERAIEEGYEKAILDRARTIGFRVDS